MDQDGFLKRLREKDELILQLKKALLEKERYLGRLQVDIAGFTSSGSPSVSPPIASGAVLETASSRPLGEHRVEAVKSTPNGKSDRFRHMELPNSVGVFADGWLAQEATILLNDTYAGREIVLRYFLPKHDGFGFKWLDIEPSFADRRRLRIEREILVEDRYPIPGDVEVAPTFSIVAEVPEPLSAQDSRNLGVFLIGIKLI